MPKSKSDNRVLVVSGVVCAVLLVTALSFGVLGLTPGSGKPNPTPTPYPTATPTPNPTPTPYPTATPTPNGNNLAPFPDGWYSDSPWGKTVNQLNFVEETDPTKKYNGQYTIRLDPSTSTPNTGLDFWKIDVKPGDHVVLKCRIKAGGSNPAPFAGARIGFDIYSVGGQIGGPDWGDAAYVHWGQDWTQIVLDWIVPATWVSNGMTQVGQAVAPTYLIPWCQVWTWGSTPATQYPNGAYSSWFSGFEAYVN